MSDSLVRLETSRGQCPTYFDLGNTETVVIVQRCASGRRHEVHLTPAMVREIITLNPRWALSQYPPELDTAPRKVA